MGPNLSTVGEDISPDEIRKAIVAPNKNVMAENRLLQVVLLGGERVSGKIMNQDGFSVQLVDSQGKLRSFQKSSLREFKIIDQNPMPSFASQISDQDMTLLVKYLSSLQGGTAK